jgi:hypothetical protein
VVDVQPSLTKPKRLMQRSWRFILALVAITLGVVASREPMPPSAAPPAVAAMETKLQRRIPQFVCAGESARMAIIRLTNGLPHRVDNASLAADGISLETLVTARLRDIRFEKALAVVLAQADHGKGLTHAIEESGRLIITSNHGQLARCVERSYDAEDLFWVPETPVRAAMRRDVSELIRDTVAPESWDANEGYADMRWRDDALIVRQTPENQRKIRALLEQLRETNGDGAVGRLFLWSVTR